MELDPVQEEVQIVEHTYEFVDRGYTSFVDIKEELSSIEELTNYSDPPTYFALTTKTTCLNKENLEDDSLPYDETSPEKYQCTDCEKTFNYFQNYARHKRNIHKVKTGMCDICLKIFNETKVKNYSKSEDGQPIPKQMYLLNDHVHNGKRLFVCGICDKTYGNQGFFEKHQRMAHLEENLLCSLCNKQFIYIETLKKHLVRHHNQKKTSKVPKKQRAPSPVAVRCNRCRITFPNLNRLEEHMKSHDEVEKPYKCDICGKGFQQASLLCNHKTSSACSVCPVCSKVCLGMWDFKYHMRTHTEQRDIECEICLRSFTHAEDLKLHKRVHETNSPFRCNICYQECISNWDLKYHKRTHDLAV